MSSKRALSQLICVLGLLIGPFAPAHAQADARVDMETMDTVISRLEQTLPGLQGQPSEARILARLGDLHSDRARQRALKDPNNSQNGAGDDRRLAITDYEKALRLAKSHGEEILTNDQQTAILTQTAYLYSLENRNDKAKEVYSRIIRDGQNGKNTVDSKLIGEAYAGRGELYFHEGDFAKAQADYSEAVRHPLRNEALAEYRLAWCEFNAGHTHAAKTRLEAILDVPATDDEAISFRRDMARDLATFIGRDKITQSSIDELIKYSPEADRASNLFYLGQEADRLGNRKGSLLVWKFYANSHTVGTAESLEIEIRTAQTLWDQGRFSDSLEIYRGFLSHFSRTQCSSLDNCEDLKARGRGFVHNWITREKNRPTGSLLLALEAYIVTAPEDAEMIQWTGHIARKLKHFDKAGDMYHRAADIAAQGKQPRIMEGSLLAEIECAEEINDPAKRALAYQHYLSLLPAGPKQADVRYQIAYLKFDNRNFAAAAPEFHGIALDKTGRTELRDQAAHLSLDCLAELGQTEQTEAWAKEYAPLFPSSQNDFYAAARKASVNSALAETKSVKGKDSTRSTESLQLALQKLRSTPLNGASDVERVNILKNEIILAEELNDVATVQTTAREMNKIETLSRADRGFALNHQLWAAEVQMDFNTAFAIAKEMQARSLVSPGAGKTSKIDQTLQLALLAELSGHSSQKYYDEFLARSHSVQSSNVIRAKLVRESRNPWKTLARFKKELRKTPEIYGAAVLETYARAHDAGQLRSYLGDRAVRQSSQYGDLSRYAELDSDRDLDYRLKHQRLVTKTDSQLARSLSERLQLLHQAERLADRAVKKNDFVLEIVDLHRLQREYSRIIEELTDIPTPKKLKPAQRREYRRLMQTRIEPYKRVAKNIEAQIHELWNNNETINSYLALSRSDLGAARRLLVADLTMLLPLAPHNQKSKIIEAIANAEANPNHVEIARAREKVRQNPFDINRIGELKRLESRRGDTSMVVFLDARLAENKKRTM